MRDIAASKAALVYQAVAVALTSDSPAAWDGTFTTFGALARAVSLDPGSVAAAGSRAGLEQGRAGALSASWLRGTDGDATIGRTDGQGTVVYFTDGASADAGAGSSPTVPLDLDAVQGAGPGWSR